MKRFLLPLFPVLVLLLLCNATTPQPEFRIVKPEEIPTLPRAHSRRIDRIIIHCSAVGPRQTSSARQIDQWHRRKGWLMIGYHYVIRRDGTIETGRPPDMIGAHTLGWNKYSLGICYEGGIKEGKEVKREKGKEVVPPDGPSSLPSPPSSLPSTHSTLLSTPSSLPSPPSSLLSTPSSLPSPPSSLLSPPPSSLTAADTRTDAQRSTLLLLLKHLKTLYPNATIHGHNEFSSKACPCFDVGGEYGGL